jgi:nucleoside-diphosphate-sugar epimerase
VTPYIKSKTLAERAAWDFIAREGGRLELSVVNPVGVFGPVLGPDYSNSILVVQRLMDGIPGCPRLYLAAVDVRDVVDLHLRAMTHPAAAGERFIASVGGAMSMVEVARVLKARMGAAARRVPTREMPDWIVRLAAIFDPALAQIVPSLGEVRHPSSEKARRVLGWSPRSNEDALVATAESLLRLGLIKT